MLYVLVIIMSFQAYAAEQLMGSKAGVKAHSIGQKCPQTLQEWAENDFKSSYFYKSEVSSCMLPVERHVKKLEKKNFSSSLELSEYYQDKFKEKIHTGYKSKLVECSTLSPEKSELIQTRFYNASLKIESTNSTLLDEIAFLDTVLPKQSKFLNEIECPPVWPELKKKCELTKNAAEACNSDEQRQKRLGELIEKTQKLLPLAENLVSQYVRCKTDVEAMPRAPNGRFTAAANKKMQEVCYSLIRASEQVKNEIPWVRGEAFEKLTVTKKPNLRGGVFNTEYNLSSGNLSEAIQKQLSLNRMALSEKYQNNLEDFRCLTDGAISGKPCDYEKIRKTVSQLPPFSTARISSNNPQDIEAQYRFEADACIIDRHQDRARTKETIGEAAKGAAIGVGVVITGGLMAPIASGTTGGMLGGLRIFGAASNVARFRMVNAIANIGAQKSLTASDLKSAYDSCSKKTQAVIEISKKTDLISANVCSSTKSSLSQAQEEESNCILMSTLAGTGVLQYAQGLPVLGILKKAADGEKKFEEGVQGATKAAAESATASPAVTEVKRIPMAKLTPVKTKEELLASPPPNPAGFPPADMAPKLSTTYRQLTGDFDAKVPDMYMLTPYDLKRIPDGTVLHTIEGKTVTVGKDNLSGDTLRGYTAYGLLVSDVKASIEIRRAARLKELGVVENPLPPAHLNFDSRGLISVGSNRNQIEVNLISREQMEQLPAGTALFKLDGSKVIKGVDDKVINEATAQGGFLPYGFRVQDIRKAKTGSEKLTEISGPPKGIIQEKKYVPPLKLKSGETIEFQNITKGEYDKLPEGTVLYGYDGKKYVKGESKELKDIRGADDRETMYGFNKADIIRANSSP